MNENLAIVIPVYKKELAWNEEISFRQTLRVLGSYPIIMVCPKSLELSAYNAIAGHFNKMLFRESFKDGFFANIAGYNRLLLSEEFYQRFQRYDYILIAQLDTFIFRDELEKWCAKGYDYVGAPWFGNQMNFVHASVGNGGLSLRRVKAFTDYFRGEKHVVPIAKIASRIHIEKKVHTRWLVWLLMLFGWRNTPRQVAERYQYNEDNFWCDTLCGTNYELNLPPVQEALEFAWERFPSEIYKHVGHLPMGCHAWEKYEYETFWRNFIK